MAFTTVFQSPVSLIQICFWTTSQTTVSWNVHWSVLRNIEKDLYSSDTNTLWVTYPFPQRNLPWQKWGMKNPVCTLVKIYLCVLFAPHLSGKGVIDIYCRPGCTCSPPLLDVKTQLRSWEFSSPGNFISDRFAPRLAHIQWVRCIILPIILWLYSVMQSGEHEELGQPRLVSCPLHIRDQRSNNRVSTLWPPPRTTQKLLALLCLDRWGW